MKKSYILFILSLLLSCTEEVNLVYPEEAAQLVVNSTITPDSTIRVTLNKTQNINDTEPNSIENALITFSTNLNNVGVLQETKPGIYTLNYKPKLKQNYKIEIATNEFGTAYAQCYLPDTVAVSDAHCQVGSWYDEQEQTSMTSCQFTIHDPADETNYYELVVWGEYHDFEDTLLQQINYLVCNNPVMIDEGILDYKPNTFFFSDKLFNGQDYIFSFDCSYILTYSETQHEDGTVEFVYISNNQQLKFKLRSISESYYQFRTSWTRHYYNQKLHELADVDDIVRYMFSAEPVRMFSNIENGLGVFVAYSETTNTFIFDNAIESHGENKHLQ